MRYFLVITVHKTYQILFVECTDIYTRLIIKTKDKVCVLNNHHPFCFTFVNHVISKSFLIFFRKRILCIGAEFRIVWGIKKNKVLLIWLSFTHEILKIKIIDVSICKVIEQRLER